MWRGGEDFRKQQQRRPIYINDFLSLWELRGIFFPPLFLKGKVFFPVSVFSYWAASVYFSPSVCLPHLPPAPLLFPHTHTHTHTPKPNASVSFPHPDHNPPSSSSWLNEIVAQHWISRKKKRNVEKEKKRKKLTGNTRRPPIVVRPSVPRLFISFRFYLGCEGGKGENGGLWYRQLTIRKCDR